MVHSIAVNMLLVGEGQVGKDLEGQQADLDYDVCLSSSFSLSALSFSPCFSSFPTHNK